MVRILGGVLVIAGTSLLGYEKGKEYDRKKEALSTMKQILFFLRREIEYANAYLGEAFLKISELTTGPYKQWCLDLSRGMKEHSFQKVSTIWEKAFHKNLFFFQLPKEQKRQLKEFGKILSENDKETMIKQLCFLEKQLEEGIWNLDKEKKEKQKLYYSLGIMSGLFLVILLL